MRDWEERFTSFLKARGLTFTRERKTILEAIFATHDHFDVDSLHEDLKKRGERISVATIYRLIPLLVESGMIRQAVSRAGHPTYEHLFGHLPHHHLICVRCGRVAEFREERIEKILDGVCEREGFSPIEYRLGVRAVCSSCRREEKK